MDLGSHFSTWITEGLADWPDDKPYPVFLVAAEGGGIRAAYWPAILLGELQDKNPGFSDHVYAISGVSGGSLGAAVFAALVKGQKTNQVLNCAEGESDQTAGPTRRCAQTMLSRDFLAPTVGYMLYPDMLARFLPVSLESFDRSLGLEESWQRAWREAVTEGNGEAQGPISNQFGDGFSTLWTAGGARVPALFLNSTWVETGKRVIASNVRIVGDTKSPTHSDAIDFLRHRAKGRAAEYRRAQQRPVYVRQPRGNAKDTGRRDLGTPGRRRLLRKLGRHHRVRDSARDRTIRGPGALGAHRSGGVDDHQQPRPG